MKQKSKKTYKAAIYVRRKFKDIVMDDEEDLTTAEQMKQIRAQKDEFPDVTIEGIYMDRKRQNKSDPRPEFIHFLQDLHAGNYNCVIFYSVDTFGKDFEENSYYLLKQFPMMRLRIILISENYDSQINEPLQDDYSKLVALVERSQEVQISRRQTIRSRSNPETTIVSPSYTPYGYLFNPENRECLEVDPVAAPAVSLIFEQYVSGTPLPAIVKMLEEKGYPCPSLRKYQLGYWDDAHQISKYWLGGTVTSIIKKRVYTGDLEIKRNTNKGYLRHRGEPAKWITEKIIENHHPALISRELFDKAQLIFQMSAETNPYYNSETRKNVFNQPLHSLVYCGSCGSKMCHLRYNQKGRYAYGVYRCPTVRDNRPDQCLIPNYRDDELWGIVREAIYKEYLEARSIEKELKETGENSLFQMGIRRYDEEIHMLTDLLTQISVGTISISYDALPEQIRSEIAPDQVDEESVTSIMKGQLLTAINNKRDYYKLMTTSNPWLCIFLELDDDFEINRKIARCFITGIGIYEDRPPVIVFKREKEKERLLSLMQFAREGR